MTEPVPDWRARLEAHRAAGRRIVTTNGCFDVLHAGHLTLLEQARALGDVLVVGINSDASVRRLKGPDRPRMSADDRARLLAALAPVDDVVVFDDDLPLGFLDAVRPHVHVKGGDYSVETMPETPLVRRNGGDVRVIPLVEGRSSSAAMVPTSSVARPALLEILRWSNALRQTGYALADTVSSVAASIGPVIARGGRIAVSSRGPLFDALVARLPAGRVVVDQPADLLVDASTLLAIPSTDAVEIALGQHAVIHSLCARIEVSNAS